MRTIEIRVTIREEGIRLLSGESAVKLHPGSDRADLVQNATRTAEAMIHEAIDRASKTSLLQRVHGLARHPAEIDTERDPLKDGLKRLAAIKGGKHGDCAIVLWEQAEAIVNYIEQLKLCVENRHNLDVVV